MVVRQSLSPGRDLVAALIFFLAAVAALEFSRASDFATLNIILDTCAFLLSGVLAFLLWDLGWRTGQKLAGLMALCFVAFCCTCSRRSTCRRRRRCCSSCPPTCGSARWRPLPIYCHSA
jgi:hypothetical protein